MNIIKCQQGTQAWFEARAGKPTASMFDKLITPLGKAREGKGVESYIDELMAEEYLGNDLSNEDKFPVSSAVRHGIEFELEARNLYSFERDAKVCEVGFCLSDCGRYGASPDGVVYADDNYKQIVGGIELKCPQRKTQMSYLRAGVLPQEYKAQVHGALLVTGAEWWDFMSYTPTAHGSKTLPPLLLRVTPDSYTDKLRTAVEAFCEYLGKEKAKFAKKYNISKEAA